VACPEGAIEIEVKLTVLDRLVLAELERQSALGVYTLRPAGQHAIIDEQWDTPDRLLGRRRLGLRLRSEDGVLKVTFKGASRTRGGLFTREELEVAADHDGRQRIADALARAMIPLDPAGNASAATRPSDWLTGLGLQPTQIRSTARRVLIADLEDEPRVELALDTTTYRLRVYEVTFCEIEAEALNDESRHAEAVGSALMAAFPGRLEASLQGKYNRGLQLARLLD
jgi:inorganic triphosphatase YgiF